MIRRKSHFIFKSLVVLLLVNPLIGLGQNKIGFTMQEGVDKVEIPFEQYNNLIAIPITINRVLTLKFILDSGAESAILTEKLFGDMMGLNYVREILIQGPGLIDSLKAYVASDISMSLSGQVYGGGINMLVLEEDFLELNKNLGEEIYGIIGYDIFKRFVVEIDYENNTLALYRPEAFKPRKTLKAEPLEIIDSKPYLRSVVNQNGKSDSLNLLIDSGASHALLLDVKNTQKIEIPHTLIATQLGQGLGGEIPGFIGRMNNLFISDFNFEDVLVSIPIDGVYMKAIKRGSRHGTIGGEVLTRFNVTLDYAHKKIYFSKNRSFREPFEHNMSGITLSVEGEKLDSLVISDVRQNSPAYHAGIRKGDVVLRMNGLLPTGSSVSEFNALLRQKDNYKVHLVVLRDDEKLKMVFRLKRLI